MWGVVFGVLLTTTGVVLVSIGSGSLNAADVRREALLRDAFALSASSPQYDKFQATSTFGFAMDEPVYTSFYLWNLTNGEQVLGGLEQPQVRQIGPYTYEKKSRKVNVTFHTSLADVVTTTDATTSKSKTKSKSASDYGYVSYGGVSSYAFVPQRSNGTEADVVVTLNATYARTLAKYREQGYSERLMVADFAQRHMEEYNRHLNEEFVAQTKQRALQFFLPKAIDQVTRESVGPAIQRQRQRVDSASLPANLVKMHAVARAEAIPQVLGDVMKDISDRFLPEILQEQFDTAKDHALPRVLSNLQRRLKVEAVPVLLQQQIQLQYMRHVPITLNSLASKISQLAFPYVMQETFERACLEVVPFMLRTIKLEIIQRDIDTNRVQADVAQNNVIETWCKRSGAARVDFDAWIDDNPTGQPRTGFELRPTTATLELSKEVAILLLGSKTSNKRFSIVDYDVATTATYPLDVPTDTPVGFAIWKQVIAMNETSIDYLIAGVNNDVALVSDYITRDQVMFIRDYLMQWAQMDVVLRDRERFWRQNYVKRTTNSDFNEPAVDLDVEKAGVQTGFNLQATGASTSGVTPAIARQLWNASDAFSFSNVQGFTTWYQAAVLSDATARQALLSGVTGLTSNQVTEVSTWIASLLGDGFVKRRALRHWADGTCRTVFKLGRTPCLVYDLEPHIDGTQAGFEVNPQSSSSIIISQALREELWDQSQTTSFLKAVHAADITAGYGRWLQAVRIGSSANILTALSATYPTLTTSTADGITAWLRQWSANPLHVLQIQNWWRTATCWPREVLSSTTPTTTVVSGQNSCTESTKETDANPARITTPSAAQSPFSTTERDLQVEKIECAYDTATSKYTKTTSLYATTVREYSCDALSTEISDDHAATEFTTGFELAPLVTVADAALRPSLAVVTVLWNPANTFSFLHPLGYKRWVFDYPASSSATRTALTSEINAKVAAACSSLTGTGLRSAIFNVTLIGSDASCGLVTADQVDTIQKWVASHSALPWVNSALLDQWRRGDDTARLDIEPYRTGKQDGWELAIGCGCALTTLKGTMYNIPRAALALWDGNTHQATFLSTAGYALWLALANATQFGDTTAIAAKKQVIATACGLAGWETWLDNVVQWLNAWRVNEHLVRDVLSHWLHGTCPTSWAIPAITLVSESTPVVSTSASCPPLPSRYTVSLNDTLDDILEQASRPQFAQFFDAEVVDKTAYIQPTKVVKATENFVDCEFVAANSYKRTSWSRVSVKQYHSCNFLRVLADGTTANIPIVEEESPFEMNRTNENAFVSMDAALAVWLNGSSLWAFTNLPVFLSKWQPAIHRSESRTALETAFNTAVTSTTVSSLEDVTKYLQRWETSSHSVQEIAKAWLVSTRPYLDLDPNTDGDQGGFELFTSPGWRKIAGSSASLLPSVDKAQYLWDASNVYSFLNADSGLANGLPVGFKAWREMYSGVDYSSERLVARYPEIASVERDDTTAPTLDTTAQASLLALMGAATSLTSTEIKGIASWLMTWSENVILRDYILELWATGSTPRGEADATVDLRLYVKPRLGLDLPNTFTITTTDGDDFTTKSTALLKDLTKSTRRSLWDVSVVGSLVNPVSREVWCFIELPTLGRCPHVLNELGVVNDTNYISFLAIVQPVLQDLPSISRTSNLTAIAMKYIGRQFSLRDDQIIAIARWWRSIPDTSIYFQALQTQRWYASSDPLAQVDPLRFGLGLASVLPADQGVVSRRAGVEALVANAVDISPGTCAITSTLAMAMWKSSNPASFLHPEGLSKWLDYAEQASPRQTSAFVTLLSAADTTTGQVIAASTAASVSCTVEAVANWLLSWRQHPFTRQLVESLWYQPSTSAASPLGLFTLASPLVQAFPATEATSAPTNPSEDTLALYARIAELVFDYNESVSFRNLTRGFPMWRALLVGCASSTPTTFKCAPVARNAIVDTKAVNATLNELTRVVVARLQSQYPTFEAQDDSVFQVLRDRNVPWLLYWLDHSQLLDFILTEGTKVDATLTGKTSAQVPYADFPAIQFSKGTISRANYPLPAFVPTSPVYSEHLGVGSEHISVPMITFDPAKSQVIVQNATGLVAFGELKAFCDWNEYDREFAYDQARTCLLGSTYSISSTESKAILSTLSDPTTTSVSGGGLRFKRAALLLDAFLAQPFASTKDCTFLIEKIAAAYELSTSIKQNACKTTADGILLDLPLLSAMGFGSSLSRIQDFHAYIRYAATKFVYEPSVLRHPSKSIDKSDLAKPVVASTTLTQYPVGGYVSRQLVADVLSPVKRNVSLWQTTDNATSLQRITYVLPLRDDSSLLYQSKESVVGDIVAVNGSTVMTVLGTSFPLGVRDVTDGSQFTKAVLSGQHGLSVSPPTTLLFYWDYPRRIVEMKFAKNITRFGVPLMRYNVQGWQSPSGLPSGVDASAPSQSVNITALFDSLPIVLAPTPATPAASSSGVVQQSRDAVVDIDPTTGMVYHQRMSWQLTARVSGFDVDHDFWHAKTSTCWLPVVWVREQRSISAPRASEVIASVVKSGPFATEKLAMWGVVGGCAYIVIGVAMSVVYVKRARAVRLHKLQSVMPASSSTASGDLKKPSDNASKSLARQVNETSDVQSTDNQVSSSAPRARKRTVTQIQTIAEGKEDVADVQQV